MIKIQQQKKQIKLNKSFYPKEIILAAINDFSEICIFLLKESDNYFLLDFEPKIEDNPDISNEFCNYCLGLLK